jgi:hypothetical protein
VTSCGNAMDEIFAGLTTAAITRNERYHQFYAIFFLVQTIVISFVIFHTLV